MHQMRQRTLTALLLLPMLVAATLGSSTRISTASLGPPSFGPYTFGIVTVSDITITGSQGGYDECTALATVNYTDASNNPLVFNVTGLLSQSDHSVFSFTGVQYGTWTFPGGSPILDFLVINYTSSNKEGHVSGGSKYGKWTLEVDLDFLVATQAAIGFVVTDQKPQWGDLPGAPQGAFDALNSLLNVGIVLSSYSGTFQFTSGAHVSVQPGFNIFAASIFRGIQITWKGSISSSGVTITADVDDFPLEPGLQADNTEIVVQFPTTPSLSINTDLTWTSLNSFHLTGIISTTDIHFTGTSSSVWNTSLGGSNPVQVTNIDIDLDLQLSGGVTAELRGTMTWPPKLMTPVTVTMKYPADGSHPHCVSLTADMSAAPPSQLSVADLAQLSAGSSDPQQGFPQDAKTKGLFGTNLIDLEIAMYPGCGAFFVQGIAQTGDGYGTVTMQFAVYKSITQSQSVQDATQQLPSNPPVDIKGFATAPASDVMNAVATAFQATNITVPYSNIANQTSAAIVQQTRDTCKAMRLPLLLNLTEYHITVDCIYAMDQVLKALNASSPDVSKHAVVYPRDSSSRPHVGSEDDTSVWMWAVTMTTQNVSWPLDDPPNIKLVDPSFALASGSFTMTIGDTAFVAQQGLNFQAQFDVGSSTNPSLEQFKSRASSSCQSQVYQVLGYIQDQSNWFLQGELQDGCIALNSDAIELSSTSIRVQSSAPQVSLATSAMLPQIQNFSFQASATFGTDSLSLSGSSTSIYTTKIGNPPMVVTGASANLNFNFGSPGSFQGSVHGAIVLHANEEITVDASIDTSSKDITLSGEIHEDKPVYLGPLLERLLSPQEVAKIPLPASIKDKLLGMYLVDAKLNLGSNPVVFEGSGEVICLLAIKVSFDLGFDGSKFHFGFALQYDPSVIQQFKFSDVLPKFTSIDGLDLVAPALAIATGPVDINIPGMNYTIHADAGLSFAALFQLQQASAAQETLQNLAGENQLIIGGLIDPMELDFALYASTNINKVISKGIVLTGASVFVEVKQTEIKFGVEADCNVTIQSDVLPFAGQIFVSDGGVGIDLKMTSDWHNPFGLKGLTVSQPELSLTLSPILIPSEFGISGAASFGKTSCVVDIYADLADITSSVLAAEIQMTSMGDVATSFGGFDPAHVSAVAGGISLAQAILSVNFGLTPVYFHNVTFPPGIELIVNNLTAGPIVGSCDIEVNPTKGIEAKGSLQPFNLDNILSVSEAYIDVGLFIGQPATFIVDSKTSLLGITAIVNISFTDAGTSALLGLEIPPVEADLSLTAIAADAYHPKDFRVAGDLNFNGWLNQQLPVLAAADKNQWDSQLGDLQKKIDQLNNDISDLNEKIKEKSANDTAAKQKAEQVVADAQKGVDDAKSKVDDLQKQIDDNQQNLKNCGKFDYACQAKYKAIIVSLQAAKATADAALSAAQQVLQAAQDELAKIPDPDVDPQIIGWKAEVLADQVAVQSADGTIGGLEKLIDFANQVVQDGPGALKCDNFHFSTDSYASMQKDGKGSVHMTGKICDHPFDINIGMVINDAKDFANDVWEALKKLVSQ